MRKSDFIKTFVSLLVSSNALASYSEIPQSKLEAYKTAVHLAGQRSGLSNCTQSGPLSHQTLVDYVYEAQTGKVDFSGAQPVLVFEAIDQERSKRLATIVSSPDFKKIISIKAEEFAWNDINIGDLLRPEIVKGYDLISSGECH